MDYACILNLCSNIQLAKIGMNNYSILHGHIKETARHQCCIPTIALVNRLSQCIDLHRHQISSGKVAIIQQTAPFDASTHLYYSLCRSSCKCCTPPCPLSLVPFSYAQPSAIPCNTGQESGIIEHTGKVLHCSPLKCSGRCVAWWCSCLMWIAADCGLESFFITADSLMVINHRLIN